MHKSLQFLMLSIVLALSISLFKTASAQDFTSGYVITIKGDTLKGQIYQSQNQENYLRINTFLDAYPDTPIQYTPTSIREYGLKDGSIYRSFTLDRTLNPSDISPIFLKVLIERGGDLSLLVFRNAEDQEFYFLETRDGNVVYIPQNNYRTFLNDYAPNCEEEFSKTNFSKLQYTTRDLSKYVNTYNRCFDESYEDDYSYISDKTIEFGVYVGTGFGFIANPNYTLDSPDFIMGLSIQKETSKHSSIILEFGITKKSLNYEATQKSDLFNLIDDVVNYNSTEVLAKSKMDIIAIYSNIGFKRTINNSLYLALGAGMAVTANSSTGEYNVLTTDQEIIDSQSYTFEATREFRPSKTYLSFNFGVGVPFKINGIEPTLELRANYNAITSSLDSKYMGNREETTVSYQYVQYKLEAPKLAKVTLDFILNIPIVYSR